MSAVHRLWALLLALGSGGCLLGDVSGIPCAADDACASDAFCDLPRGTCVPGDPQSGPPHLDIVAVEGPAGDKGTFTTIPTGVDTRVLLYVKNVGDTRAEQISLELSDLHCAYPDIDLGSIPDTIDPGDTHKVVMGLFVEQDCKNPVPYDWFLRFSDRERRGVFELFFQQPE